MPRPLPLKGRLVISLEQAVAAPLCTRLLAEAGARVIKIERAEGDFARGYDHVAHGESAYFTWLNHGKESIVLDIKADEDRALLNRMIARADIFVQNLAPGACDRAGIGSAALRARHPQLITCDISGYGADGPARNMKAYDLLIQCETGLTAITGSADAPGRVGVSIADIASGMNAHGAVLEALLERDWSGNGSAIAISLFDSLADWMAVPLLHHDYGGSAPQRVGLAHPSIAPYGAFACQDKSVVIAIQNEREWRDFCCQVLGAPELADDPRFVSNAQRCANRTALDVLIGKAFARQGSATIISKLTAAGTAFASVNEVADLSAHPQLRRMSVGSPTGTVDLPAPPVRWMEGEELSAFVPAVDQHGPAIRREFMHA